MYTCIHTCCKEYMRRFEATSAEAESQPVSDGIAFIALKKVCAQDRSSRLATDIHVRVLDHQGGTQSGMF